MSQHSSLRAAGGSSKHRSVLKRYEKVKKLKQKGEWDEEKSSPFKIRKIKQQKFKVKKQKSAKDEKST